MTKGIRCMTSPKSTRDKLDRLQELLRGREPLPTTSTPKPKEENTDSKDPLSRLENELLGERSEGGESLTVKERLERLVGAASRSRPKSLHALDEGERQIVSLDEVLTGKPWKTTTASSTPSTTNTPLTTGTVRRIFHGSNRFLLEPVRSRSRRRRAGPRSYADRLLGYRNNGTRRRLRHLRISRRSRFRRGRALQGSPVLHARLLRRRSHAPRACGSSFRLREPRQLQR